MLSLDMPDAILVLLTCWSLGNGEWTVRFPLRRAVYTPSETTTSNIYVPLAVTSKSQNDGSGRV